MKFKAHTLNHQGTVRGAAWDHIGMNLRAEGGKMLSQSDHRESPTNSENQDRARKSTFRDLGLRVQDSGFIGFRIYSFMA